MSSVTEAEWWEGFKRCLKPLDWQERMTSDEMTIHLVQTMLGTAAIFPAVDEDGYYSDDKLRVKIEGLGGESVLDESVEDLDIAKKLVWDLHVGALRACFKNGVSFHLLN